MNGSKLGLTWFTATIAYMIGLLVPGYGLTIAPILAAIAVVASRLNGKDAALVGLLAGLTGYALLLGIGGGIDSAKIIAGIGGPLTVIVAFSYHLVVPAALSYLAVSIRR